tara:strand:+ start:9210 stop:9392 length:183 start_codon:yes stop_codon:yes gene_type:complete
MTPEELLRFAKYRRRLQQQNKKRPAATRMTDQQIQQKARKAAKSGVLNEHGIPSVKREDI